VEGNVIVDAGAEIVESVIRGPAVIGSGAKISRSYVGPFTSIGPNVGLRDTEIEHSIVLEGAIIMDVANRIEDSLIGCAAKVYRAPIKPAAYRFMLGDNSEVGIQW
jgi:glucose-1-phosphate thymidylyltransferase